MSTKEIASYSLLREFGEEEHGRGAGRPKAVISSCEKIGREASRLAIMPQPVSRIPPKSGIVRLQYPGVVTVPDVTTGRGSLREDQTRREITRVLPIREYRTVKRTPRRLTGGNSGRRFGADNVMRHTHLYAFRNAAHHHQRTSPGSICIPIYTISRREMDIASALITFQV